MSSNDSLCQFPDTVKNPRTSLAFLTPTEAEQIEATRFLYVSSLAAFLWDVLCTLSQDYRLLTQHSISLPTVVYFISRISTLVFVTASAVFYAAPVGSCRALTTAIGWCWAVSVPSTSLLFFLRARAVFDGQRPIIVVFVIFWLATLGGSLSVPFSISGDHIENTDRCWNTSIKPLTSAGFIASTCNDTFIFIAISWSVIRRTSLHGKVKSFFCGGHLPYISKALVQGGQEYYFITVAGNIASMALILSPRTPPLVKAMFPVPSKALENAMACRVFRDIKLAMSTPEHTSIGDHSPPSSGATAYKLRAFRPSINRPIREPVVEIRKTVEQFDDRDSVHVVMHDQGSSNSKLPHNEDEFV